MLLPIDDFDFLFEIWVINVNFEQETVQLCFWQTVRTFLLHRILCCQNNKWQIHHILMSVNGYLTFFHHLKQCRLCFCWCTVNLINQNHVRENWPFFEFEFGGFHIKDRSSQNITRHQIWCELYSAETYIQGLCQEFRGNGLSNTRNTFNQGMSIGQDGRNQHINHAFLSNNYLADFIFNE